MDKPWIERPRRIVTGHDAQGRSVIVSDGDAPVMVQADHAPSMGMAEIWRCDGLPPSNAGNADGALLPFSLAPATDGVICRVVHFPPDRELNWSADDANATFAQFGGGEVMANEGTRHAAFHRTQTLDFAVVLEGEIVAMMDVGETLMKPGDILVQRGTRHAWANRSARPCRVCFVAVSAEPLPRGNPGTAALERAGAA
ncbi:cupin domain-containing protein [Variovorax sp. KK3]|uniref:cupin domain-containing protein n=1 Tax=Variovorax sp. KK3 TaxID=1855728 RepID=UPI0009FB3BB5|nr:cupin domain-containing protein [Variovorax sp. KK3]